MALTRLRLSRAHPRGIEATAWWLAAVYLAGVGCWLLVQQLVGDGAWWLFLINAMGIYLFVPLPLALAVALWRRSLPLGGGSLAAVAVFALLWGGLF
ncbi:MAG TPA: hypothetical protein VI876_01985, partial [Dehalococcoidia bacterium]|nr:hypothetical protein [Dehalococcoidia bacterium]